MPYSMPFRSTFAIARREPDVEAARPHPDRPGGEEVACLMNEDEQPEAEDRDEDVHGTRAPTAFSAWRRASASARTSSSRSAAGAPSTASSVSATTPAMSRNESRPARKAATATSFAALNAHGCVPPDSPARLASASSGNVSRSGGSNSQGQPLREVEPLDGRCRSLRIGQRVGNRDSHIRVTEVRERGAVAEADDRVDDRGRMHHDLDLLVGQVEQEVRLDQLEPLVGERGRVDGDLRPHLPGRMRQRVGPRNSFEVFARSAAKRALPRR